MHGGCLCSQAHDCRTFRVFPQTLARASLAAQSAMVLQARAPLLRRIFGSRAWRAFPQSKARHGRLNMNRTRRLLTASLFLSGLFGFAGASFAKPKHHHHNGAAKLGDKLKTPGQHVIDKKGPHTVSVETKDGKIAAFHVKHDKKGELPVKKYKTNKKMAQAAQIQYASYVQAQYLGTTWIGYSYIDEFGDEEIYWYPYDMVYDGDTGAVEYIPV